MDILLSLILAAVWHNSWNDGHQRILSFMDKDLYDKATEFNGIGSATIDGKGILSLTGDAPRYRVLEKFENVNATFYAMRIDEKKQLSYQGFVVGARSQHYTDRTCGANTYYASLTYDGRVSFQKELFHGTGSNAFYPNVHDDNAQIFAFKDGVPKNQWIGIRFIVKSIDDNTAAILELYLDKEDNGKWQKVLDYKDDGNWYADPGHAKCDGYYPENKIITEPGFVFIRNDGLGRADYKNFSIKEIR